MSNLFERKNIRLKNYDYSQNGLYFITVCTHGKVKLFGQIVEAAPISPIPAYRMELG
jgi:putative transposase